MICDYAACNHISEQVWRAQSFGRLAVNRLTYHEVRAQLALTAQLAVRCIGKVVDAYKLDQERKRQFKKLGALPYDSRILNWRMPASSVSIWLLGGRQAIPLYQLRAARSCAH